MVKNKLFIFILFGILCCVTACGDSETGNLSGQPTVTTGADEQTVLTPTPTEVVTPTPTPTTGPTPYPQVGDSDFPCLYERYQDYFSIGIGVVKYDISMMDRANLILSQFNSMTCGNEMKADAVLDYNKTISEGTEECPVLNFGQADAILRFCQNNNIPVRGHTLIWHSQTPKWFFTEGYSKASDAPLVTKEVMLKRMENYIRLEMEYINTTYPGLVYAWDVVNEAVDTGAGVNGYRAKESYYYQIIGEEYIEKAFEFARKYADPEQKLFYNDFNTHEGLKAYKIINILRPLVDKGLVDGIGLQSHLQLDYPSLIDFRTSVMDYAELGVELHITELDIDAKDNSEETQMKLAKRYKNFFAMLCQLKDSGIPITNVTIWGLSDEGSWLTQDGDSSWPILFNWSLQAKPAYWGAMQDESIQ